VIAIQEAYASLFNVYIDELNRQTGQTWRGVFATHCPPGAWNGSSCTSGWSEGVGIFTTFDITGSSSTLFPFTDCWTSARAAVRASLNVNGTTVQVIATHLQTGGCTDSRAARYNSMARLKSWASGFSTPQLVAGDFNADPDQIDIDAGMGGQFVDSWSVVGSGRGFTAFAPNPTMKIDYWFSDSGGRAQPTSSQVVYSTGSVSDHFPVQTTFVIR
jgi:endonuclease/exonuclease/phosphatase family metal-dependent hydrolase